MRVGIIGCGAIGSVLFDAFDSGLIESDLIALYDIYRDKCREIVGRSTRIKPIVCEDIDCLIDTRLDVVVEAASQEAVRQYAEKLLSNKINLVILSVGALLDIDLKSRLEEIARKNNVKIYIPTGAIAGIDAVKAASIIGIDEILLITRKNPRSVSKNTLLELGFSEDIREETVIFEGSAEDAVKRLPMNINVAATLKLASRAPVYVKFILDPRIDTNRHEIIVRSKASELHIVIENAPHPENPKTSYIAALSAIQLLKQLGRTGLVIGT